MDRKEAIEIIIKNYPHVSNSGSQFESALRELIPELREGEDERIRKEIVDFFSQYKDDGIRGVDITSWIAYLEKQKDAIGAARQQGYEEGLEDGIKMNMAEQMGESKEWADELSAEIDRISKRYQEVSFAKLSRVAVHFVRWQKDYSKVVEFDHDRKPTNSEKPKVEWSEEDEQWLESIIKDYEDSLFKDKDHVAVIKVKIDFLKSLRPKPKEELAKMFQDGQEASEREGYIKGYYKGYKDANESVSYHFPVMPAMPSGFGCDGTHCTNPHMDCINCPIKSTGGRFNAAPNSGNLTLKADWKPSDEQMDALCDLLYTNNPTEECFDNCKSLYEDLKKL